ncbi:MAG: hypothetical protein K5665_09825 [Saccharofermentans sp.]|nr:hypothetical protein [Saccharofermentans sp.]
MKLTKTVASALIIATLCCGCTKTAETTGKVSDGGDKEYDEVLPEDEVLIVCGYRNEAWGHQSSMTYVMSDGKVYSSREEFESYPLDPSKGLTDEQRKDLLVKYTDPVAEFDEKDLKKIYHYMLQIDTDAEFVYADEYACDAGTHYTNVNIDGEFIRISEAGDRTGNLKDRFAKKVDKLIDAAFASANIKDKASVYSNSESFITTIRCSDIKTTELRRIITSTEELEAFKKDTGINLLKYDAFDYFGDPEYDKFGYICIAVEIVSYPDYLSVEDVSADAFIVSDSYTGFAYLEDPVIDVSEMEVKENMYVHVVQLPAYQLSDYDLFLNGS